MLRTGQEVLPSYSDVQSLRWNREEEVALSRHPICRVVESHAATVATVVSLSSSCVLVKKSQHRVLLQYLSDSGIMNRRAEIFMKWTR